MIRNLIFDFGNVFVDLDQEATLHRLREHGVEEIPAALYDIALNYEKGLVTTDEFIKSARLQLPEISQSDLIEAWNAILLDMPERRLDFLHSLSADPAFTLILLSNSNELHIAHLTMRWGSKRMEYFLSLFHGVYFSHEMGMRKPDPEIFQTVLEMEGIRPEQTFFVDDTEENIHTAAGLGLKTWHLRAGIEDITELQLHLS